MKNILFTILLLAIFSFTSNAQRILIDEDFETAGFNSDSLPTGWAKYDVDNSNPTFPLAVWSVRDSSAQFPGVNPGLQSRAHNSARSVSIPWRSGDPEADDFLITDTLRIQNGDSLIFWMLFGTPLAELVGGVQFSPYKDSMQVGYSFVKDPVLYQRITTLVSHDTDNVWEEFKFDLSSLAGQTIFVCFRYYMNTTVDGLWCNIDDIFVGNHSAIGIQPISGNVPKVFALRQNYPNPFNPVTNIEFDLPKAEFVNLVVFNTLGQEVKTLVNETKPAGSYRVDFDASGLPSGAYFYRITAGDFVQTNKMMLVK
jgi:hypothetical protein